MIETDAQLKKLKIALMGINKICDTVIKELIKDEGQISKTGRSTKRANSSDKSKDRHTPEHQSNSCEVCD